MTWLAMLIRNAYWTVLLTQALFFVPRLASAVEVRSGEQIYREACARCHGASGEGTPDKYPHPLAGKRSQGQLAKYIAKSMPEDKPGTCTGSDAEKVAAFIYEAFYSPTAQARNKPARVELSRLTVRQYRNAVADLVGSFRADGKWGDERGLHGEYFKSRRFRPNDRAVERLDPMVRFDFGTDSPVADKLDANQFSIRWTGSVLAPETGIYEFIIRTEHAGRLWVNDLAKPLIDAWVKSGNDTEYRASLFLIGGRAYPMRLEFSKAKQGVDDSAKNKGKPAPKIKASVALEWKLPGRVVEPVPSRNLSPQRFPELFVATTAFPPDDRSTGWERGTSISKAWDEATTEAAIETAGYVSAYLPELAGGKPADRNANLDLGNPASINLDRPVGAKPAADQAKLREFCRQFAERAFRRPLTAEQQKVYVERQFAFSRDPETAVKRVVLLVLKSPRFLYRELGESQDSFDVASRLAFGLCDTLPDKQLLEAAARGRLATREQVTRHAERLLADVRTRSKLREFFLLWLKVEQHPDLAKDNSRFPGFDRTIAADLRSSLDLFLEDVVWNGDADFRQLFLADTLFLNGRLARFYGADLPADAAFQKVSLDPGARAGVLTHPYLTATFAYTAETSPIHRGVFLSRSVLGRSLRPPPEAFAPLPAELHPELTTRERVALQTKPTACLACHGMINPLGFTLEHFDAVGRYRDKEHGKPIDATGEYQTRTGEIVRFGGVRDLAMFLANSEETQEAFVEQLFHHLVKQPIRAFGPRKLAELRQAFADNRYNVRKLMVEIMATSALKQGEANQ